MKSGPRADGLGDVRPRAFPRKGAWRGVAARAAKYIPGIRAGMDGISMSFAGVLAYLPAAVGALAVIYALVIASALVIVSRSRPSPELRAIVDGVWPIVGGRGRPPGVRVGGTVGDAVTFVRTIVVAEPLADSMDRAELRAVLAHESAHAAGNHTLVSMAVFGSAFLAAFCASLYALLGASANAAVALAWALALAAVAGAVSASALARRLERRADEVGALVDPMASISALGRISRAAADSPRPLREGFLRIPASIAHDPPVERALRIARAHGIPEDEALDAFRAAAGR